MGLYAYLRAAAAYVAVDEVFGVVGYGCKVITAPDGSLTVFPNNGVDQAVYFSPDIEVVANGALSQVSLSADRRSVHIESQPTHYGSGRFVVHGLPGGQPTVNCDRPVVASHDGSGVAIDVGDIDSQFGGGPIALTVVARQ